VAVLPVIAFLVVGLVLLLFVNEGRAAIGVKRQACAGKK